MVEAATEATSFETMQMACRALDRVLLWGYYQLPLDAVADPFLAYWDMFGRPAGGARREIHLAVPPRVVVRRGEGCAHRILELTTRGIRARAPVGFECDTDGEKRMPGRKT